MITKIAARNNTPVVIDFISAVWYNNKNTK